VSEPTPDLLAELLRAAAQRDQVAFAELYRLTSGKLFAVARRMFAGQADPLPKPRRKLSPVSGSTLRSATR